MLRRRRDAATRDCALHARASPESLRSGFERLQRGEKRSLISARPRGGDAPMLARALCKVVSAGLPLLALTATAQAAEVAYPTKPIRLIVPFPPGGSADPLARAFGAWFSEKFGVTVVADNRPGAGTAIAHTLGAKAAPDGDTLLLGASSGLTTNPAFGTKLDYDP